MSPNPLHIKEFIKAKEEYRAGNHNEAAKLLAQAIGAGEANQFIHNNLNRFLGEDSSASDIAIALVAAKSAERKVRNGN